ncbi:MAG: hypothetical protein ACJ780_14615 [Solirubrobacteraceae bacterium]
MARQPLPVFVGRVWMNGDPWLMADRAEAEKWTGFEGDYDRILELGAFETTVDVGGGSGVLLSSDYDDSTVEVFRIARDELLIVGVRYADADVPYAAVLEDAVGVELEKSATMPVASGEVAILASALPWSSGTLVREKPMPLTNAERRREPNQEILILNLDAGDYVLSERHIDRANHGLAVWRLHLDSQAAVTSPMG